LETEVTEKTESHRDEKTEHEVAMIEAALYVAGRPLDLNKLGSVIDTKSKRKVQRLARMLKREYERRNKALEVLELEDKRFVLQLKPEYSLKVRRLAVRPLLTSGPLKTLSYIAYRQPVSQIQIISVRGRHAYNHIKQLIETDLIEYEKNGKTKTFRTTEYFADYFGLSRDLQKMKRRLRNIFKDLEKNETPKAKEPLIRKE